MRVATDVRVPVVGYEGLYEVSEYGDVYRVEGTNSRGYYQPARRLKQARTKSGHYTVALHNGCQKTLYVHRIVAEALIPNPKSLPLVRHLDDDPANNKASNLSWGNKADNHKDAVANGRIKAKEQCIRGHRRTTDNLDKGGACRMCNKERSKAWRETKQLDTGEVDMESAA